MPTRRNYKPKLLGGGTAGYKLVWKGEDVYRKATADAGFIMGKLMLVGEQLAKSRLYPHHGVDTSTMHNRVHVDDANHDFSSEHIEPVDGGGPVLGGQLKIPEWDGRSRLRLVLGSPQDYSIYYHQKHDPFLLIGFQEAMRAYKAELQKTWRLSFR